MQILLRRIRTVELFSVPAANTRPNQDLKRSPRLGQMRLKFALNRYLIVRPSCVHFDEFYYSISRQNVGPAWLLNTLAGLYWRGQGKTANGIDCFRAALSGVPDRHAHLPLTNLAALLMHNGHDADALT